MKLSYSYSVFCVAFYIMETPNHYPSITFRVSASIEWEHGKLEDNMQLDKFLHNNMVSQINLNRSHSFALCPPHANKDNHKLLNFNRSTNDWQYQLALMEKNILKHINSGLTHNLWPRLLRSIKKLLISIWTKIHHTCIKKHSTSHAIATNHS